MIGDWYKVINPKSKTYGLQGPCHRIILNFLRTGGQGDLYLIELGKQRFWYRYKNLERLIPMEKMP